MYLPPQFNAKDRETAWNVMRSYPFASLISTDDDGLPFVTHIPLHLVAGDAVPDKLLGHCAKPNPHWRYLEARPQAVVTFLGPHAYLSPGVLHGCQPGTMSRCMPRLKLGSSRSPMRKTLC